MIQPASESVFIMIEIKLSWNSLKYSCMDKIVSLEIFSDKQVILHFVPAAFLPKIRKNTAAAPLTLRFSVEDFPKAKIM